jgi:hypothetical protein
MKKAGITPGLFAWVRIVKGLSLQAYFFDKQGKGKMRKFGFFTLAILTIPLLWLGSAFVFETWHSYVYRFRLTIEVETPEGLKSGSSVIEAFQTEKAGWIPQSPGTFGGVRGEAVFVDLGNGKNIIALLARGPNAEFVDVDDLPARALRRIGPKWYQAAPQWTESAELTGNDVPTLVTFTDPSRPETARIVRPEDLEATFGPGFRFKGALIEMTRAPLVSSIDGRLPWLRAAQEKGRASTIVGGTGKLEPNVPYFKRG